MPANHSIAEARNNLPSLVREVEAGKAIELTRHGRPVAILIGCRQYERLTNRRSCFSDAFDEFSRDVDLQELDLDPHELFGHVRDRTRGREVDL